MSLSFRLPINLPAALVAALLCANAWAAPVPILSDSALNARLSDSASHNFSNIWDILSDAGPADRATLNGWISTEMDEVLQRSENTVVETLEGTSNRIFVTRGDHLEFVIKSIDDPAYALGEHYAYQVSEKMGLNLVPPTRIDLKPGEPRMAQLFIRDAISADGTPFSRDVYTNRPLFDDLIDNVDRHEQNILITPEGNRAYIDHGRSFGPVEDKYTPELTRESYMDFFDSPESWQQFNSISESDWEAFFRDNPLVSHGVEQRLPEEVSERFINEVERTRFNMQNYLRGDPKFLEKSATRQIMIKKGYVAYHDALRAQPSKKSKLSWFKRKFGACGRN